MSGIDPITAEILRSKLRSLVDNMAATMANVSRSPTISESRDFANALFTASGDLAMIDNPLHFGGTVGTMSRVADYFQFDLTQGDTVVTNDPYSGGTHVQDVTLITPYFWESDIVAFVVVRAHMPDVGGEICGGYNHLAREVLAEGVRITPVKMVRGDRLESDVLQTLLFNSRLPEVVKGEIEGMLATTGVAQEHIRQLIGRYGVAAFCAALDYCIDYAETRTRSLIAKWPKGEYFGEASLDEDFAGGRDLRVSVKVTVSPDSLELDFTNTAGQSDGFVNATPSTTQTHALLPILGLLDEAVPRNAGLLRAVKVITKPGTLVHASYPAPVGFSPWHVGNEVGAAVTDALSQAVPEKASPSLTAVPLVTLYRQDGAPDVAHPILSQGGASANHDRDGWGMAGFHSDMALPSVEMFEAKYGCSVGALEYRGDSGGPGYWRGGLGTDTIIEFHSPLSLLAIYCEGLRNSPPGVAGGQPGDPNQIIADTGLGGERLEGPFVRQPAPAGTKIRISMAGGPGWGSPWQRPSERVLQDVMDEYVSIDRARLDYGVIVEPQGLSVNREATQKLREAQIH